MLTKVNGQRCEPYTTKVGKNIYFDDTLAC
jgi:hypothetical protein